MIFYIFFAAPFKTNDIIMVKRAKTFISEFFLRGHVLAFLAFEKFNMVDTSEYATNMIAR